MFKQGHACGEYTEARDYIEDDPCEKCFKRRQPTIANKAKDIARRFSGGGSGSGSAAASSKKVSDGQYSYPPNLVYLFGERTIIASCTIETMSFQDPQGLRSNK